jgi:hypothetical protein
MSDTSNNYSRSNEQSWTSEFVNTGTQRNAVVSWYKVLAFFTCAEWEKCSNKMSTVEKVGQIKSALR